jgi:hypothetical protein
MLGMISVPGMFRRTPLAEAEGSEPEAAAEDRPPCSALPNAPRSDTTLLTASGDTCGAVLGSPIPGAVVASSGEIDGGGGP